MSPVHSTAVQRSRSSPPLSKAIPSDKYQDRSYDTQSRHLYHSPERAGKQQNYNSHDYMVVKVILSQTKPT
jgi:hypothetical protein